MVGARRGTLVPAQHDPRVARVFLWYARRLVGKKFRALHAASGTRACIERAAAVNGPMVVVLSHSSWWDPIIGLLIGDQLIRGRTGIAPIDAEQLEKFRFFRKLGLFGIDPDDRASLDAMLEYSVSWLTAGPSVGGPAGRVIAITAQGRFADPREPVKPRPGAAALCAKLGEPSVISIAIEYGFWQDQLPEVFVRAEPIRLTPGLSGSTTDWHRAIEATMQLNADQLAKLVIARDPAAFEPLLKNSSAKSAGATSPVYDLWLRIRGKRGGIDARRASQSPKSVGGAA